MRQIEDDGAMYFGPYASSRAVRETLRYINDTIPIRKCPDNVFKNRVKPCLYYQIYKCLGPCCDLVDEVTYQGLDRSGGLDFKRQTGRPYRHFETANV